MARRHHRWPGTTRSRRGPHTLLIVRRRRVAPGSHVRRQGVCTGYGVGGSSIARPLLQRAIQLLQKTSLFPQIGSRLGAADSVHEHRVAWELRENNSEVLASLFDLARAGKKNSTGAKELQESRSVFGDQDVQLLQPLLILSEPEVRLGPTIFGHPVARRLARSFSAVCSCLA